MKQKPKYTYAKRGSWFVIISWEYGEGWANGTKIKDMLTFDQARDEVYRLNGWKAPTNSPDGGSDKKAHGRL